MTKSLRPSISLDTFLGGKLTCRSSSYMVLLTKFKSSFPFDLHSFGDWFLCAVTFNDILWPVEVDPFGHPRLEDVLCDFDDKVGGESLGEYDDGLG